MYWVYLLRLKKKKKNYIPTKYYKKSMHTDILR